MAEVYGTDRAFSCTRTVHCSPEVFWPIWTDVPGWPRWDTPLLRAQLTGAFVLGASGQLVDRNQRTSRFTLTECRPLMSYAYTVRLPGAALQVRRVITSTTSTPSSLNFQHQVRFTGPLGFLWARVLGRSFRQILPEVMNQLVQLVETAAQVSNKSDV
ncbi:SRPBCC family protein [Deinococcus sp. Arct2-2]|uniref:SRPBCC family protein n=1 Tax=Deinococcus sp. Arct2-2 TaxID=2568653 RepID=UPI001454CB02|nr:SRPBCC family protein [Deinococcus sp. Arct2-2]